VFWAKRCFLTSDQTKQRLACLRTKWGSHAVRFSRAAVAAPLEVSVRGCWRKPSKASKRPWTRARGSTEAVSTRAKHFNSLALDAFNLRRLLDTPAEARAKRHRSTHHFLQPLLTFIPASVATFQRRGGDSARCAKPHQGGAPPGLPRRAGRSATPVEGVFGSSLSSLTVGACL